MTKTEKVDKQEEETSCLRVDEPENGEKTTNFKIEHRVNIEAEKHIK